MVRTIRQQLIAYSDGWLTPADTLDAALGAYEQCNGDLNALVTTRPIHQLRSQADQLSASMRRGDPVGSLVAMPYAAKDTHKTAGLRTTFGSPIFEHHVPDCNEPIVERLLAADALLVGKSNTPEFAAGSQTFNPIFGVTRNPYDRSLTVGGSSRGSACALATGMCWVADGSDLAASLRNPASFCGVVGMRPSSRSDPLMQPGANGFGSLSLPGPMARSVDDLRLAHRAVYLSPGKYPIRDWASQLQRETQATRRGIVRYEGKGSMPRDPRTLRIAWTIDGDGRIPVDAPVHRAMRRALHVLKEAGVELIQATPDLAGADECFQTLRGLYFVENYGALYWTDQHRMKDTVLWNIEFGLDLTAERIAAAMRMRTELFERMRRFMTDIDGWLLPTAQVLPFALDLPYPPQVNGEPPGTYVDWLKSCYWITVTGHPAVSIPGGFETGPNRLPLPVGIQIAGHWGGDEALLDVAETLETLFTPLNAGRLNAEVRRASQTV